MYIPSFYSIDCGRFWAISIRLCPVAKISHRWVAMADFSVLLADSVQIHRSLLGKAACHIDAIDVRIRSGIPLGIAVPFGELRVDPPEEALEVLDTQVNHAWNIIHFFYFPFLVFVSASLR